MPELIKSAGEQLEAEMRQRAGRANTKLQLATQYAAAIITGFKADTMGINGIYAPKDIADYALELAEELLSGWEASNGLSDNVPKGKVDL